jgi:hypothetical protein
MGAIVGDAGDPAPGDARSGTWVSAAVVAGELQVQARCSITKVGRSASRGFLSAGALPATRDVTCTFTCTQPFHTYLSRELWQLVIVGKVGAAPRSSDWLVPVFW